MQNNQLQTTTAKTELAIITPAPLLPKLTERQTMIITATKHDKIKTLAAKQIQKQLDIIILQAFKDKNQKPDPIDVKLTVDTLVKDLKIYCESLTMQEISIAIHEGVIGLVKEYNAIDAGNCMQFIFHYQNNEERKALLFKQNKHEEKVKETRPPLSEKEKDDLIKQGIVAAFEEFKTTKKLHGFPNLTYDYLNKKKLIHFTSSEKDDFKKLAQIRLRARLSEQKSQTQMKVSGTLVASKISEINNQIKQSEDRESTLVLREAKSIALEKLYLQYIQHKHELKDLLK